jgi:hypothetical protein
VAMCHEVAARVSAAGGSSVFINTGPRPEYPAPYGAYVKAGFEAVGLATQYIRQVPARRRLVP